MCHHLLQWIHKHSKACPSLPVSSNFNISCLAGLSQDSNNGKSVQHCELEIQDCKLIRAINPRISTHHFNTLNVVLRVSGTHSAHQVEAGLPDAAAAAPSASSRCHHSACAAATCVRLLSSRCRLRHRCALWYGCCRRRRCCRWRRCGSWCGCRLRCRGCFLGGCGLCRGCCLRYDCCRWRRHCFRSRSGCAKQKTKSASSACVLGTTDCVNAAYRPVSTRLVEANLMN